MRRIVLDTSAIIRLYVPDGVVPEGLADDLDRAASGDVALLVPELALAEVGQVLKKKEKAGFLTPAESDEILDAVLELPLDIVGHREILRTAVDVSRDRGLAVYDALFLALALDRKAELVSADVRLQAAFAAESDA